MVEGRVGRTIEDLIPDTRERIIDKVERNRIQLEQARLEREQRGDLPSPVISMEAALRRLRKPTADDLGEGALDAPAIE